LLNPQLKKESGLYLVLGRREFTQSGPNFKNDQQQQQQQQLLVVEIIIIKNSSCSLSFLFSNSLYFGTHTR